MGPARRERSSREPVLFEVDRARQVGHRPSPLPAALAAVLARLARSVRAYLADIPERIRRLLATATHLGSGAVAHRLSARP